MLINSHSKAVLKINSREISLVLAIAMLLPFFHPLTVKAEEIREIVFPVQGAYSFSDSFGDPRSGGRTHEGIDIFAAKMTPLISAIDGRVSFLPQDQPDWGYGIFLRDNEGYSYRYIHVNNDTPGTDDGMGGVDFAYAPTILRGESVLKGELIGWVGDSGNAENVGSHLHFEIRTPDGTPINPYFSLLQAEHPGRFDPETVTASVGSISENLNLPANPFSGCAADSLMKTSSSKAVYYCGADGKRYVFPNDRIYASWYDDFSGVTVVSDEALASVLIGGNVTYKPGVRMIKITTDPHVYVVDRGSVLRHVLTPEIAASMYGANWSKAVDDLPDAFFGKYTVGEPVSQQN